ncbi:hypothetical protein DERP_004249 [Dermatophagoides pteronyssinus]|uniref:Uncharacterized protein n=1 Tax=Dermatophagoides pteronyssinus TaxID=6956 RepID=A0ABQ8J8L1_DERPT|nr:hypothetical protein DERP_004249 [Dermatophagoides pteronyssinus]
MLTTMITMNSVENTKSKNDYQQQQQQQQTIWLSYHEYLIIKTLFLLMKISLFILIITTLLVFIYHYRIQNEIHQRIYHALNDRGTLDWPMPDTLLEK